MSKSSLWFLNGLNQLVLSLYVGKIHFWLALFMGIVSGMSFVIAFKEKL